MNPETFVRSTVPFTGFISGAKALELAVDVAIEDGVVLLSYSTPVVTNRMSFMLAELPMAGIEFILKRSGSTLITIEPKELLDALDRGYRIIEVRRCR